MKIESQLTIDSVTSLHPVYWLQITHRRQSLDEDESKADEWRTVAIIIDRLLFCITLVILVALAIWMAVFSFHVPRRHHDDVRVSVRNQ